MTRVVWSIVRCIFCGEYMKHPAGSSYAAAYAIRALADHFQARHGQVVPPAASAVR